MEVDVVEAVRVLAGLVRACEEGELEASQEELSALRGGLAAASALAGVQQSTV